MKRGPRGRLRAVSASDGARSSIAAETAEPAAAAFGQRNESESSGVQHRETAESIELDLLVEAVRRRYGVELPAGEALDGTVRELARRCGGITRSGVIERLLHDAWFAARAVPALVAAGGSLFDDAPFYRAFVERVIPWLRTWPFASIWAPQCGEEGTVLSMAILLAEAGLHDRCRIYATDDDAERLQRTVRRVFARESMSASEANYRRVGAASTLATHMVERDGAFVARQEIANNIVWSHYSVDEGRTFNEFTMIVCRRHAAERSPERCRRVARLIDDSLSPLGLLAVSRDRTDPIVGYLGARYRDWDRAAGLLQRVA